MQKIVLAVLSCSVCGCGPSAVRWNSPPQQWQSNLRVPPARTQQPAVVSNPWKPDESKIRDWRYLVIHHTASNGGSVESIHAAHLDRGWIGIGYHFLIGNGNGMDDGEIAPTFRWRQQLHGAHAGNDEYNQHGIGVCLVGNFNETNPTAAQLAAVKRLVGVLKSEYGIASDQVIAHRDVKATACPGKNFPLAEVGRAVAIPTLVSYPATDWAGAPTQMAGVPYASATPMASNVVVPPSVNTRRGTGSNLFPSRPFVRTRESVRRLLP